MDQLQLDIVLIQDTFRELLEVLLMKRYSCALVEYSNTNKRSGFRIASDLEPFLLEQLCLKSESMKVLTSKFMRL